MRSRWTVLIVIILLVFFPGFLSAQEKSEERSIPDFQIDLDRRRTFWIPLQGHGWLYSGCRSLFSEELPEYAQGGDPVLSGKQDSESRTHFLIRFRFPGDYYLNFFYQDFEPLFEDDHYLKARKGATSVKHTVHVRVFDSREADRDSVALGVERKSSIPLNPSGTGRGSRTGAVPGGQAHSVKTERSPDIPDNSNSLSPSEKQGAKNPSPGVEADLTSLHTVDGEIGPAEWKWLDHPLFPDRKRVEQLQEAVSSDAVSGLVLTDKDEPGRGEFELGLYYYSLGTPSGMKKAYSWFNGVGKNHPASAYAREADARADYIYNYYLLIR